VAGLAALAFLILFFTAGQPFGTFNDLCIAGAAILASTLAWMLYPAHRDLSRPLSQWALVAAAAGAAVVAIGSALVVTGHTGWYLAGLYMSAGNALLGLWLLGLCYSAWHASSWPRGLVGAGLIVGAIMAVGLLALLGIITALDAQDRAPWIVNAGFASSLGWLLLFPAWCIWLGLVLLAR
jgi:hypothetical protein